MGLFSFNRRLLKQIDWWIIGAILVLTAFGLLVIYGTTYNVSHRQYLPKRQVMWWAISLTVFVAILFVDYSRLAKLAAPAYVVCLALLVGLVVMKLTGKGLAVKGALSWYKAGPVRFQPSEFTKIAVILVVAAYLARIKARLPGWLDLGVVTLLVALPFVLIALQPDLGTAAVFLPLAVVLPWVAGAQRRIYLILAGGALALFLTYGTAVVVRQGDFPFLKSYQERRVKAFLAGIIPGNWVDLDRLGLDTSIRERADWAPRQALIAVGSGRIWGKGWKNGTQTRLEFLPEAHTDYIFSSCGEQFGFAGCAFVLILYALLVHRSLVLALRSKDWFGYLIVVGVLCVFATHVFLNIGVATDLLPVTGLPLPFLSAGGSFLLTTYVGFALVVNVGMRKYMF